MEEDKLLKPVEVAARLGLTPTTVTRRIRQGTLPGLELANGRTFRVPESELQAWLEQRRSGPAK